MKKISKGKFRFFSISGRSSMTLEFYFIFYSFVCTKKKTWIWAHVNYLFFLFEIFSWTLRARLKFASGKTVFYNWGILLITITRHCHRQNGQILLWKWWIDTVCSYCKVWVWYIRQKKIALLRIIDLPMFYLSTVLSTIFVSNPNWKLLTRCVFMYSEARQFDL